MFVVSALIEFAFVVLLSRAPGPVKIKLHHDVLGKAPCTSSGMFRRRKMARKESTAATQRRKCLEKEIGQVHDRKGITIIPNMPPIHIVDLISFCIFISLFVLFNIIYWISYQI